MDGKTLHEEVHVVVGRDQLQFLIDALIARGYEVIGPTVRDAAIVYDHIDTLDDLPQGWSDEQAPGSYRLRRRADAALFAFNCGPQSWKPFLHPPTRLLWSADRDPDGQSFTLAEAVPDIPRRAFFGVRACELRAIEIQDRVFGGGPFTDPHYQARRANSFVVAVNCSRAGNTCFCASMQSGPRAEAGFDLALTELIDEQRHEFLVEIGSSAGAEVLLELPQRRATAADLATAERVLAATAASMGRHLNTKGLRERLYASAASPRWDAIAERCLACGNCTMVCPTCFCSTVEDSTDLSGQHSERHQRWDSCFTLDFSYVHGGSLRSSVRERYRQWLTHKLASWIDQFGTAGCVGCGRCITWCPVGIDLTEEVKVI